MSELLSVSGLTKRFGAERGGRQVVAVDGVSFTVAQKETLGLVGESGCGKSTLGRTVLRLIEPDGGKIVFEGQDITKARNLAPVRRRMQMVFQNPGGSLDPRMSVRDIVAEGLDIHRIGTRSERTERVYELLNEVGLTREHADRYPAEFSGGQQQRVGIARALALDPVFLVCDEVLSALDLSYQSQIISLLESLQAERGLSYLFISHDVSVVRHISDRVAVMYLGRFVETGEAEEITAHPAHPYTRALLASVPIPDPLLARSRTRVRLGAEALAAPPTAGCAFAPRCPAALPRCAEAAPPLRDLGAGHFCACWQDII